MSNPMRTRIMKQHRTLGTSLVEVLVVMVIFLLGILAVLQIFPGGIRILSQSRDRSVAAARVRAEMELLKGDTTTIPEMILPVYATYTMSGVRLVADSNRVAHDLSPMGVGLDANGNLLDGGGNILGPWQFLAGSNVHRRIIGEGGVIPAPRAVGSLYGGLLVLRYAPILYNTSFAEYFEVYGNDMQQMYGDPTGGRVRDYQYFVTDLDQPSATIYLPRSPVKMRHYRLSLTAWVKDGSGSIVSRDIVTSTPITVPANAAGGFESFSLAPYILSPGETLVGIDADSMRVSRLFDLVFSFTNDPYEYRLVNDTLGLVLFNPAGYNYKERRSGGRLVPLVGRVNYFVYDWRILKEDFRMPGTDQPRYRLIQGNLAITGKSGADGLNNPGLPISEGQVGSRPSLAVIDLDTGGVYTPDSLQIDGSRGVVNFVDKDGDPSNGLQLDLTYPGDIDPTRITADSRSSRVLYMVNNEWSVQVLKAASRYSISWGPPGVAQYYVGGSNTTLADPGRLTRIYLPRCDLGRKITIDTIYYRRAGDNTALAPREMSAQDFVVSSDTDSFGTFVDIASIDPEATSIDLSFYGYGVRNVKGASIGVRVLWNPTTFRLTGDSAENMRRLNNWIGQWRKSETETYLQRSEN